MQLTACELQESSLEDLAKKASASFLRLFIRFLDVFGLFSCIFKVSKGGFRWRT